MSPLTLESGLLNSVLLSPARRLRFIERTITDATACCQDALTSGFPRIESLGHRLKGSASTFAFDWLSMLGARLEEAARRPEEGEIKSILSEILQRCERERREILRPMQQSTGNVSEASA